MFVLLCSYYVPKVSYGAFDLDKSERNTDFLNNSSTLLMLISYNSLINISTSFSLDFTIYKSSSERKNAVTYLETLSSMAIYYVFPT